MEFELSKDRPSIIKVIGVGGGGSNAVNHMFRQGIHGVDFMICNTDVQALDISPVRTKVQLGPDLTEGLGAGSVPEKGREAAKENINDVKAQLQGGTKMVFITAGMGGGTGTGAAPVIAGIAKSMNILTVGIVTVPFTWEGKKRKQQALDGLKELQENVDTLLVISNDRLREMYGDLKLTNAYSKADDILTVAAKSIAEIITVTGYVNVDFADVQTVLKNSGVAIMGRAMAEGADRARIAAEAALDSPLLNDNNITGARHILLNITSGNDEISMDEVTEITDFIQEKAGLTADIIFGTGQDESLGEKICITVIATGFKTKEELAKEENTPRKQVLTLNDEPRPTIVPEADNTGAVTSAEETMVMRHETVTPPANNALNVTQHADTTPKEDVIKFELNNDIEQHAEKDNAQPTVQDVERTFTYEFDVTNTEIEEIYNTPTYQLSEVPNDEVTNQPPQNYTDIDNTARPSTNDDGTDKFSRTKERIMKLRELTYKLSNNNTLNEMEKVPAYERKSIDLQNPPSSSQSNMSRFTVSPNGEDGTTLRENNSFLHDKVD